MDSEDFLPKLIYDLFFRGRESMKDTSDFRFLKHNTDLVPNVKEKLDMVLDSFERYRRASHDIQGMADHGVDVLLTYDSEGEKKYIGFQVKSYDDLKPRNSLKTTKAALLDTQSHYGNDKLVDFYLLLCTDVGVHGDKVRRLTGDIAKNDYFKVHVVSPENALFFLRLTESSIGAYLKNKLSDDDVVLREARESLSDKTLGQAAMIIDAIADNFLEKTPIQSMRILESSFVNDVYENFPRLSASYYHAEEEEQKNWGISNVTAQDEILEIWGNEFSTRSIHSDDWEFDVQAYFPLVALLFDAKARHDYSTEEIKDYLFRATMEFQMDEAESFARRKIKKRRHHRR